MGSFSYSCSEALARRDLQNILDHHIGGIKQRGHILEVMRKTTPNSAVYSYAIIPEDT
jgi:hypothetical protein